MNGRVYIVPLDAMDDENRWAEIARVTDDRLQFPEGTEMGDFDDLLPLPAPADESVDVRSWGQFQPVRHIQGVPATPQDSGEVLEQIDRALAALCACGADPSEEFYPYCSYDCEPNIRGEHTDSRESGELATPMRWRPDLVAASDEVTMTDYTDRVERDGLGHQVWLYPGGERVQLRVDDGHRFIGADMDRALYDADDDATLAKWAALRRQFRNQNHLEPEPAPPPRWGSLVASLESLVASHAARVSFRHGSWEFSPPNLPPETIWMTRSYHLHWAPAPVGHGETVALHQQLCPEHAAEAAAAEETPMQRALQLRRERNTGPRRPTRVPRRIDPTRGR